MSDEEAVEEEAAAPTAPPAGYVPVPPGTELDANGNPLDRPSQEEIAGLPETEPAPALAGEEEEAE